jgi:hypothetical protein
MGVAKLGQVGRGALNMPEENVEAIAYAHWLHRRRVGAMSETEKTLERVLGFALLDPDDPRYSTHWLVLHPPEGFDLDEDDEWYHPTIRRGDWPRDSESAIQRLWHKCVELSEKNAKHRVLHGKLSFAAGAVMIGSLVVPLLLAVLHLVTPHQFDRFWHYGTYLSAAALGALIAGSWTSD